ncbi:MAG TPA: DUF177 domain-containing protein [Longimicrobiales bacterium]|nr:DUF177 domain-containing protein [Longimicrobiales bacterium]
MLRVDLGRLAREGSVLVEARVPADHRLWSGGSFQWKGPVEVRLHASYGGSGEIVARGSVSGERAEECRRCLDPVSTEVDEELTMVFAESGSDEASDGADVYTYDPSRGVVDLAEAVREELILAMNPYVVCDPECRGLCPRCGANLNEGDCGCVSEEVDPRWEALRALQEHAKGR